MPGEAGGDLVDEADFADAGEAIDNCVILADRRSSGARRMRSSIGIDGFLFNSDFLAQGANFDDQALKQTHLLQSQRSLSTASLDVCGKRVSAIDFAGGFPS